MLDDTTILNYVGQELSQSAGAIENDSIEGERQAALGTYLGQYSEKVPEGRSSVVSTDVADAIEWVLPDVMKAFTQNNQVVTFDAEFAGDEQQALLESQYVYDILMKDNNGFLILHQMFKDALMQKNGFVKIGYIKKETVTTEEYTGLMEEEFQMVLADPNAELLEMTENQEPGQPPTFDVKIRYARSKGQVIAMSIPPEEFRVNRMHNSIDLADARFTAHVVTKTRSDLIKEGYDQDLVESVPYNDPVDDDKDYRFYMQNETTQPNGDVSSDMSLATVEVAECYMQMDIDEDGVAELVKITVAGNETPNVILDIEEIDRIPFISTTAILMSHKLFGLSLYDRLKDIQEQKTTLWRNILDNIYLQNNQRHVVLEGQVNLDDLMISRPGGIIRASRADAVTPLVTPPLPKESYQMMDYLDQVRTGRAGVTPDGPIRDEMIGDRVGSEGVERLLTSREELVGLMIRVFAETGVKAICYAIRGEVIKHQDVVQDYMFRGQWVKVAPMTWTDRSRCTVRVGTGSGNRKEQLSALSVIMNWQEQTLAKPGQALIDEATVYNAIDDFARFAGMTGASRYALDPMSPQGQQKKQMVQQQQQQEQQYERQKDMTLVNAQKQLVAAESGKVAAQRENNILKARLEGAKVEIQSQDAESKAVIEGLQLRLDKMQQTIDAIQEKNEMEFKYWDRKEFYKLERQKVRSQERAAKAQAKKQDSSSDG